MKWLEMQDIDEDGQSQQNTLCYDHMMTTDEDLPLATFPLYIILILVRKRVIYCFYIAKVNVREPAQHILPYGLVP